MAAGKDLKKISLARIKASKILMENGDCDTAYYIIGHALECALKAVICKTLNFDIYPDLDNMGEKVKIFKTHSFDTLLSLSGMEKDFDLNKPTKKTYNWSQFTKSWVISDRYQPIGTRTKEEMGKMIQMLEEKPDGIISWIRLHKRW